MKILILGDYSGIGINLKEGFLKCGVLATLISIGDGWKKIGGSDIKLRSYYNKENKPIGIINRIKVGIINRISLFYFSLMNKSKYDKILVINSNMILTEYKDYLRVCFSIKALNKMLNKKNEIYLSACGDDYYFLKEGIKYLTYSPYMEKSQQLEKIIKRYYIKENKINSSIKKVIPVMYEYELGYRDSVYAKTGRLSKIIPLPITCENLNYTDNRCEQKIVIFHGVNRKNVKGSEEIIQALNNIQTKYENVVKIIIKERLPIKEYLSCIENANIIIDQCKSYSYGMNCLIGMALGKVVFSGNEKEIQSIFGQIEIPVVNIKPNVKEIENKIIRFIENKNLIKEYGAMSRLFVEEFHDSKLIALKYLEVFNEE